MEAVFRKVFLEHPEDIGETYAEHLLYVLRTFVSLIAIALVLLVHGFVPSLFTKTASTWLMRLTRQISERFARQAQDYHL